MNVTAQPVGVRLRSAWVRVAVSGDVIAVAALIVLVGVLATVYTAFLLYAAGLTFVLLSFILLAPGTILFVMARREQGKRLFSAGESVILAISLVGAVAGIVALATGAIAI